jgi:hypothetical protein
MTLLTNFPSYKVGYFVESPVERGVRHVRHAAGKVVELFHVKHYLPTAW